MNNEQVMQLMADNGMHEGGMDNWVIDNAWVKFANLVAEHEREACANLGEKLLLPETFFETTYEHDAHKDALLAYRNAIHARGAT